MKEMTSAVTRAQREARSASDGATPITVCAARIGPARMTQTGYGGRGGGREGEGAGGREREREREKERGIERGRGREGEELLGRIKDGSMGGSGWGRSLCALPGLALSKPPWILRASIAKRNGPNALPLR